MLGVGGGWGLALALGGGAGAEGGWGDVEVAAPVAGGGVEPYPAVAGDGDLVDGGDALGKAQDGAHASVLVTHLDAHAGDGPQVALAVEGDGVDVQWAAVVVVVEPVEGFAVCRLAVLQDVLPYGVAAGLGRNDGDGGQVGVDDAGDGLARGAVTGLFPALVVAAEESLQEIVAAGSHGGLVGPVAPHPLHDLRENLGGAGHVVATVAPVALHVIASKLQGAGQHLVALIPVAEQGVPRVVAAVLDEDAQGQWLGLPDERLQVVAAAHGHKGAHSRENLAEQVGAVPCRVKCRDAAAAQAENHPVLGTL